MTEREQLLAAYERAWCHREEPEVRAELERCWTPDTTYVSPLTDVVRGIDGMVNLILDFPVMFPEATLTLTSQPDVHHDAAYFTWRLTSTVPIRMMGDDYGKALDGLDFVEFSPGGGISRITAFFGVDRRLATAVNGSSVNGSSVNGSAVNGSAVSGSAVNGSAVNGTSQREPTDLTDFTVDLSEESAPSVAARR